MTIGINSEYVNPYSRDSGIVWTLHDLVTNAKCEFSLDKVCPLDLADKVLMKDYDYYSRNTTTRRMQLTAYYGGRIYVLNNRNQFEKLTPQPVVDAFVRYMICMADFTQATSMANPIH